MQPVVTVLLTDCASSLPPQMPRDTQAFTGRLVSARVFDSKPLDHLST